MSFGKFVWFLLWFSKTVKTGQSRVSDWLYATSEEMHIKFLCHKQFLKLTISTIDQNLPKNTKNRGQYLGLILSDMHAIFVSNLREKNKSKKVVAIIFIRDICGAW